MECFKRKTEMKDLIHNKELGPGASTALNADCTTIPYNLLYLEKAPCRSKASLRQCSLCPDPVLTRNQISPP